MDQLQLAPYCGKDGVTTYDNYCEAIRACDLLATLGGCVCKPNPEANCPPFVRPVCGKDKVTYDNRCSAEAACQLPATEGECCTRNSDGPCTVDQLRLAPICGKDNVTYSNRCEALRACQLDGSTLGECTRPQGPG